MLYLIILAAQPSHSNSRVLEQLPWQHWELLWKVCLVLGALYNWSVDFKSTFDLLHSTWDLENRIWLQQWFVLLLCPSRSLSVLTSLLHCRMICTWWSGNSSLALCSSTISLGSLVQSLWLASWQKTGTRACRSLCLSQPVMVLPPHTLYILQPLF